MTQAENNLTVMKGMALGLFFTVLAIPSLYLLLPQFDYELSSSDRIALSLKCLAFPGLFFLALILVIGSQRFGNAAENPLVREANTDSMKVDLRVLSNTTEQIVVFAVCVLSLSVTLPYQYLSLLPIYSGLFVFGRLLFWAGYRHNVLWRAPGFGVNVFPAVLGLGYCCIELLL